MIRANELKGRAVVDLDAADKIGEVAEVILDPESRQVAGLLVGQGQTFLGASRHVAVPASAVHAIGPDALTVRGVAGGWTAELDALPRLSHVTGRKMVTESGTLLGPISDVLIDPAAGRIVGYAFGSHRTGGLGLGTLLGAGGGGDEAAGYVRADADLRVGPDLVVVPDGAVVRDEAGAAGAAQGAAHTHEAGGDGPREGTTVRWGAPTERVASGAGGPGGWTPSPAPAAAGAPDAPTEPLGTTPPAGRLG